MRNEFNENIKLSQAYKLIIISKKYNSLPKYNYIKNPNKEIIKIKNNKNISFTKSKKDNEINNSINIKQKFRSKSVIIKLSNYLEGQIDNIYKNFKKSGNNNKLYYRNIYSNEYLQFENETTKIPHYVKKYKEDEITFTKNKILPEVKWQNYDNDTLTSDEQKKCALKKELKNLGETIKRIQNNIDFFKFNVNMYKLSQKYPKIIN